MRVYELRPRKDHRSIDLISDVLPFGRLWYDTPENAIGYAKHGSRSYDAVIRVYDDAGKVIEMQKHKGRLSIIIFGCRITTCTSENPHFSFYRDLRDSALYRPVWSEVGESP